MRHWITLTAIALGAAIVSADDIDTARPLMASAMSELATYDRVTIDINGQESYRGVDTPFRYSLAAQFLAAPVPTTHFEGMFSKNGVGNGRLAGDGQWLWHWDPVARTYSSSRYQTDSTVAANQFADHRQRVLQAISKRVTGPASFGAHILMESFGANASNLATLDSRWRPWLSTATVVVRSSPGMAEVECTSTTPISARLTYYLEETATGGWALNSAVYQSSVSVAGNLRVQEWTATVYRGTLPTDFSRTFSAPAGSRSVSIQGKQVGG